MTYWHAKVLPSLQKLIIFGGLRSSSNCCILTLFLGVVLFFGVFFVVCIDYPSKLWALGFGLFLKLFYRNRNVPFINALSSQCLLG